MVAITFHPLFKNNCAVAAPMPLLAPVIKIVFFIFCCFKYRPKVTQKQGVQIRRIQDVCMLFPDFMRGKRMGIENSGHDQLQSVELILADFTVLLLTFQKVIDDLHECFGYPAVIVREKRFAEIFSMAAR